MKKKRKKLERKLLSFLLTLAMVIGLMPGMSLTVNAATNSGAPTIAEELEKAGYEDAIAKVYFMMPNGKNGPVAADDVYVHHPAILDPETSEVIEDAYDELVIKGGDKAPSWLNEFNKGTDGNYYAGIYWSSGPGAPAAWPGYKMEIDDVNNCVYYAEIPGDGNLTTAIFNNGVDGGTDSSMPIYYKAAQTVDLNMEGAYEGDYETLWGDTYNEFDFAGCIYVIDPNQVNINALSGKQTCGGDWYFYYGNGCYGSIRTDNFDFSSPEDCCMNPSHFNKVGEHVGFHEDETVQSNVDVTGVTLDMNSATMSTGNMQALTATITPNNATDKKVTWSVGGMDAGAVKLYSDENCTTEVGADATETLTVYAKGITAGSATVTVTSNADQTKLAECNVTVNAPGNYVITSENFSDYFDESGNLKDSVAEGAVLDFQGEFLGSQYSVNINKKVTITSTSDPVAKFDSNTTGTSGFLNVTIGTGADYTTISNLEFLNSTLFVKGASNVTIDNIKMVANQRGVGSGTGFLSIHTGASYAVVKNSSFENGGTGSACVVIGKGSNNGTFEDNTFNIIGSSGNVLSSNVFVGSGNNPEYITYRNNTITIDESIAASAMMYGITVCGQGNVLEGNKLINFKGNGIVNQFGATSTNNIYKNNTITGGGSMALGTYSTVEGNTVEGSTTVTEGDIFTNNKVGKTLTINGKDTQVSGNTLGGNVTINNSATNTTFTNNDVTGTITVKSKSNTINSNTVVTTDEYAVILNSTAVDSNTDVEYNTLIAAEKMGDDAVNPGTGEGNTIANNTGFPELQAQWIQDIADVTFTGEAIEPEVVVKNGETTLVKDTDYTVVYSNNVNAGTALVTITAKEGAHYIGTVVKSFEIKKVDPTVTVPTTSNLVYNGQEQQLIGEGLAEGGTMQYALGTATEATGPYTTSIPTKTNAGTYYVWYKVVGDENHNDTDAASVTVSVSKGNGAVAVAPEVIAWTSDYVFAEAVNGQEYVIVKKGETPDWSKAVTPDEESVTFTGLTPATEYSIYTRVKETDNTLASEPEKVDVITSLIGWETRGEPKPGETITIIPDPENAEGLTWQWYYAEENEEYNVVRNEAIEGEVSSSYTIKETDVGKYLYYVIFKGGKELEDGYVGPVRIAINPSVTLDGWTYGENPNTPVVTGNTGNGKVSFTYAKKGSEEPESETVPTLPGTYTVFAYVEESGDYAFCYAEADFTIAKGTPAVTAPKARNLVYNGVSQELVEAGVAVGGEMQYSLGTKDAATEEYTTTIPTATDAGTYYVWYKVKADENYNDTDANYVVESIGKRSVTLTSATASKTYDGTALKNSEVTVTGDGFITGEGADYDVTGTRTVVGVSENTFTYTLKDNTKVDNYDITTVEGKLTVTKPDSLGEGKLAVTKLDSLGEVTAVSGLVYDGKAKALVTAGKTEGGTLMYALGTDGKWQSEIPVATDAGTYKIYYYIKGDDNHKDNGSEKEPKGSVETTIKKAAQDKPTETFAVAEASDDKTADGKISGLDKAKTYQYSADDGKTWTDVKAGSTEIVVKSGTYQIRYAEDKNREAGKAASVTVTAKAAPSPEPAKTNATINLKSVTQKNNKVQVSWTKVNEADGYDVYINYCGSNAKKAAKTITENSTTSASFIEIDGNEINHKKSFRVRVYAYKMVNGKKIIIAKTITAHLAGTKSAKYTNPKALELTKSTYSIKVGKTAQIKAKVTLENSSKMLLPESHAAKLRYKSSNTKIATVNKNGKITGKSKGTCYIYVYTVNGLMKKVKVTVK